MPSHSRVCDHCTACGHATQSRFTACTRQVQAPTRQLPRLTPLISRGEQCALPALEGVHCALRCLPCRHQPQHEAHAP